MSDKKQLEELFDRRGAQNAVLKMSLYTALVAVSMMLQAAGIL